MEFWSCRSGRAYMGGRFLIALITAPGSGLDLAPESR
jgi:hypothetical protein